MTGTAVIQSVVRKKKLTVYVWTFGDDTEANRSSQTEMGFSDSRDLGHYIRERDFYYKYVPVPQRVGGCRHYLRFLLETGAFLTLFSCVLTENKHLNLLKFSVALTHCRESIHWSHWVGFLLNWVAFKLTEFPPRLEDPPFAVGGHTHGAQEENFLTFPSLFPSSPRRWRKGGRQWPQAHRKVSDPSAVHSTRGDAALAAVCSGVCAEDVYSRGVVETALFSESSCAS